MLENDGIGETSVESLSEALGSVQLEENMKENDFLQDVLEGIECPFTWKLSQIVTSSQTIRDVRNKLFELNEESVDFDHFKWNSFTLHLLLSYLLTDKQEFTEAIEILDSCVKVLQDLEEENCKEPLFANIKDALWHVTYACQIYTLIKKDIEKGIFEKSDAVEELLEKVPRFSDMLNGEKAGIYGIKTHMLFQYGHDGNVLALESAKMARDLDSDMAEWWFLVGKAMGRIRRTTERLECVDKEEIKTLEKAVELEDNTSYIVFLAQVYRECSLRAFKKFQSQVDLKTHNLGKYIDTLNEKALNLYMQALDKRKNCPRTMSRCAAGLIKLPGRYKRTEHAEHVLTKSLTLAPNNAFSHHVAGLLYYQYPYKNYKKALSHYEKAHELGNYGAAMDLLRIKSEMNPNYDPYEDLIKYLDVYKQEIHQTSLGCELGSYFLFKKRDITKAIGHYTEVIKKDRVPILKSNFVAFLSLDGPINLLKIIIDEARLALQNSDSLTKDDKMTIRRFIIEISTIAPELLDGEPEPGQVEKILEKSLIRMTTKEKFKNQTGERGVNRHNGHRDMRNDFGNRSNRGDRGRPRMRGNNYNRSNNFNKVENEEQQDELRNNRGGFSRGRGRGSNHFNRSENRNWRNEGSDNRENNWRSRSNDNRENQQLPRNESNNNNREQLRNRCWRTEGRSEKDDLPKQQEEETYRFPVKPVPKDT